MLYVAISFLFFLLLWGTFAVALPPLWRGLQAAANRLAAFTQRFGGVPRIATWGTHLKDYLPVVVVLAGGIVATALAGDFFIDVAEMVHAKSVTLTGFDAHVHDWALAERSPGATRFFVAMTIIGGPAGLAVILISAASALAIRRKWRWLVYLIVTAGGGALLNLELKHYFARARPALAEMLRRAQGYSFPSGHAMGSTVAFGALAYLGFRVAWQWRWKAASLALACTLVLAVAASRVYLGVHWISDVGAGITAGTTWVVVTTVAYEAFRRIRGIRRVRRAAAQQAM